MALASSMVVEMGFSQSTCTPPWRAGITSLAWFLFSEQTTTASTSSRGARAIEEAHAEKLRGLSAATRVFVGYTDEICGGEIP